MDHQGSASSIAQNNKSLTHERPSYKSTDKGFKKVFDTDVVIILEKTMAAFTLALLWKVYMDGGLVGYSPSSY